MRRITPTSIWRSEASAWQQSALALEIHTEELRKAIADLLSYTMPMTPITIIDNAKRLIEKP